MKWLNEQEMKQKSLLMFFITMVIMSVSTVGCIGQVTEAQVQKTPTQIVEDITPQEASVLIDEKRGNPDFVIIDVRTSSEFTNGHIDNAINIDFYSESFESEISKLGKGKPYLIYCRSGNRSRGALDTMVKLSFKEVYHLSAGIIGWLEEGLPTTE